MNAEERAPIRPSGAVPQNLPVQLTSFVGRGGELTAVQLLMTGERLVTLTGPGGCGKTRLAVQAAAELADRWPDGVWWVDLSALADPALVATTTAATLGLLVEPVGGPLQALRSQLRDRRVLVCLDNCEHLVEACAELAEVLLLACPEVSVLATSREPLGVAGETVWQVPPLVEDEAVALFVERANRVRPWFRLDAADGVAIRTLCRRLDGIPLAIELAAAWLRTLTPAEITAGLDDRFALLVRGPRGALARQQTLKASLDWSHDLLGDTDRVVFRRLATFAGSFALDAAQAVCGHDPVGPGDVLAAVGRLVDKSLVVMDDNGGGPARYRMLETIRAYAAHRLAETGETTACRGRHLDHYLAVAEAAEVGLESAERATCLARLEADHDDLRAALDWALDAGPPGRAGSPRAAGPAEPAGRGAAGEEGSPDAAGEERPARGPAAAAAPERGRRLAAALAWMWWVHGQAQQGAAYLQRAVELAPAPDDRSSLQARLLAGIALVADTGGPLALELDAARRGAEIAAEAGDDRTRGRCLLLAAVVQFYVDFATAWDLCAQAEACAAAVDDAYVADSVLVLKGMLLASRDRHEEARPLLEEGAARCLSRGDRSYAALALNYQDDGAALTGHVHRAEELATRALGIARPLDAHVTIGFAPSHLALARGLAGDVAAGRRLMEGVVRAVEGIEHDGHVPRMARMGTVLGTLCLWAGGPADLEEAVTWFERDARSTDPVPDSLIAARALPGLAAALRHLGRIDEAREVAARAVTLARRLDVPHLVADALEQSAHLLAVGDPGDDPERAAGLHHAALGVRVDHGLRTRYVDSLDALAGLAARSAQDAAGLTEAARLLAASDGARRAMGHPRPPLARPGYEATVAALRTSLGGGFAEAWQEGTALDLDAAVAYARRTRGRRNRPSSGWASLTPAERDVVRLVAEGLTNPQIAARLFVSRATVKTHLAHVYAKVGVTNRTELAALATARTGRRDESGQPRG